MVWIRRNLALVTFLLLAAPAASFLGLRDLRRRDLLVEGLARRAAAALEDGRLPEALAACGEWSRVRPADAFARVLRAQAEEARGNIEAARADLDCAVALAGYDALALTARASLRFRVDGDTAGALADLGRALEPRAGGADGAGALALRGRVLLSLGRLDEAAADLDRALELDSGLREARNSRSVVYLERGDALAALADATRALAADPRWAEARYNRARCLVALEVWDEAEAELDVVLRDRPRLVEALLQRSALRLRRGDAEGAREDLRSAEAQPLGEEVRSRLEVLHERLEGDTPPSLDGNSRSPD
ncbi:MAG: tetratricopeptide repeat protein [Planctomycetes bacterium]|nr:tetratricopeptide repeat protein [Planctomycetota bacterium]